MMEEPSSHDLHAADRTWPETNCYSDLWIELLNSLDLDPVAGLAFLLSSDFNGEQWQLFKHPATDLQALYGVKVEELHVWRPLVEHVEEHLNLGRVLTIEVDAYFLPDLAGTTYRQAHHKTTIAVVAMNREQRSATYFHARGRHRVDGDDFDGLLSPSPDRSLALPPYVEIVDLDGLVSWSPEEAMPIVQEQVRWHLRFRPRTNPVERLSTRVQLDVPRIERSGRDFFHAYAFGTLRQFGSWASTLSAFVSWLRTYDSALDAPTASALEQVASELEEIATTAKRLQFQAARAGTGRPVDLAPAFHDAAERWNSAYGVLVEAYLGAGPDS